ncbi:Leukocyte elastase inhibitor [Amphibalanus amphitrite]|uniref:Leukocyte elastase inhibitor n=1 Tax=Amphibalanus amphitrite TaxID=1232801 RepID=A0A6A4VGG2_AMPAM|nr:Leukocyte elastase inhibitor [Amphibalanus amphitrite]KAF0288551.1 Leukocyte elastase inhibitor [Amphibalanus amphitrite]
MSVGRGAMVSSALLLAVLAVVLAPAAAAGRSQQDLFRPLPGELSFDLDQLEDLDEPALAPPVGVVARRRRPLTARSYQHAAKMQGAFGIDLFQVLAAHDSTSNVVFSPMSVGTALAMLYAGSRGQTAEQLWAALHLTGEKRELMHSHRRLVRHTKKLARDGIEMVIVSDLFTSEELPLNPKFPRYASGMFNSTVTSVPFDIPYLTAEIINGRFYNATQGVIDSLVSSDMLSEDTQFVLANAVFFRGSWLMQFDAAATAEGVFQSPAGPRPVQMMSTKKVFPIAELYQLNARALLLPYKGEKLGMLILLPNDPAGLDSLVAALNMTVISDTLRKLDGLGDVLVKMPKFDIESELDLQPLLIELGVRDLFDPAVVNMTRVTGQRGAAISTAVHKARLSVSEEGTEAAAATAFVNLFRSVPDPIRPFVVDRPFAFAVLEMSSSAVLFLGRVTDPTPQPEEPQPEPQPDLSALFL